MDPVIIIVNIAALAIIVYLFKLSRRRKQFENSFKTDKKLEAIPKDELRIENVDVGGILKVSLMEDSYEDYDLAITQKNKYRSGNEFWYELIGDNLKAQVALEFEMGESLLLTITIERLKISDLPITAADLERIDEEKSGSFEFDNKLFSFSDSGEAVFYKNCKDELAEDFTYCEFKTADQKYIITCERWEDGSIEVTYSKSIPKSNVEVYSLRE